MEVSTAIVCKISTQSATRYIHKLCEGRSVLATFVRVQEILHQVEICLFFRYNRCMYDEQAERHAHGWCYKAATQLCETSFVRNATCYRAEEEIDDLPDDFKAIASHLVDSAACIVSALAVPELPSCNADAGNHTGVGLRCGTAHMMQHKLEAIKAACVLSVVMYLVSGRSNQCMLKRPQLTDERVSSQLDGHSVSHSSHNILNESARPKPHHSIRPDVSVPVDPLHKRALTQFVALAWRMDPNMQRFGCLKLHPCQCGK
jgi:hypothetical protein